jgi:SAM-dependent methyltransferase
VSSVLGLLNMYPTNEFNSKREIDEYTTMRKLRSVIQKLLLKLLVRSLREESHVCYSDFAPALHKLVKHRPDEGVSVLRDVLQDSKTSLTSSESIDEIINFSGYWRDSWVKHKASLIPDGAKVLDAGAGQCQYKRFLLHTNYQAQDFAQYQGNHEGPLQESWHYPELDYICDITKIPVDDDAFDAVLCTEVLEHVPDPIAALKELCRVTCEGGQLLISAPLGSGVHQEPYHFFGGFSPYFYQKYLPDFGCEIVEIKPLGGLFRSVAQEIHRAARILQLNGETITLERHYLLMDWLPRFLSEFDTKYFVEQFTVGYLVEARKFK